jgi:hypothetical protein
MESEFLATERRSDTDRRAVSRTTPERRRGRPSGNQEGSTVSAWLSADEHERVIRMANARRMSVSQFVRDVLAKYFLQEKYASRQIRVT